MQYKSTKKNKNNKNNKETGTQVTMCRMLFVVIIIFHTHFHVTNNLLMNKQTGKCYMFLIFLGVQ